MKRAAILVGATLCVSCVPRAVYVGPIDTFSTQAEKFNTAATAELAQYPTDFRARLLRGEVARRVLYEVKPVATAFKLGDFGHFICDPRLKAASYADESRYLGAVSESLKKTGAAPSDKVGDLIKALGTDYAINVKKPGDNDEQKRCSDDMGTYRAAAYPIGQTESVAGAIAGIKALEAIFNELAPIVLGQIDEARRSIALQDFLSNADNQAAMHSSIDQNVEMMDAAFKDRRLLSLNAADMAYSGLSTKLATLNLKAIPECKAFRPPAGGRPIYDSDDFRLCFQKVWDATEGDTAAVLTAAAKYDDDAGKRPDVAGKELSKVVDKLARIARGDLTPGEWAQALSSYAQAGVAIDTLVTKASSDDTKKKVQDALNQIKGI